MTKNLIKFGENWSKIRERSLKIVGSWFENFLKWATNEQNSSLSMKKCWRMGENWPKICKKSLIIDRNFLKIWYKWVKNEKIDQK